MFANSLHFSIRCVAGRTCNCLLRTLGYLSPPHLQSRCPIDMMPVPVTTRFINPPTWLTHPVPTATSLCRRQRPYVLNLYCFIKWLYSVLFSLWPRTQHLSRNVQAGAGFLYYKAAVLRDTKRSRHFLGLQTFEILIGLKWLFTAAWSDYYTLCVTDRKIV